MSVEKKSHSARWIPWSLAGSLLSLVACQPVSPLAPLPEPAPAITATPEALASPTSDGQRTPTPAPWGPRLAQGASVTVLTPAQSRRLILLANPHDHEARVNFQVFPSGEVTAPVAAPTPTASPGRRGVPPFGFGFDGAGREGFGLGTRRLLATGPAASRQMGFWINDGSATLEGDRQRQATLRLETDNALFYVDDAAASTVRDERVAHLAEAFERRIRPPLTRVFGVEDRPGVDGEDRLFIVLSPWVGQSAGREGMLGYFWPRDPLLAAPLAKDLRRHANQKEVIFLSTRILEQPDVTALGTLAHEYQHLLTFCAKTRIDGMPRPEATWLDEGLSMLAMDLAGFGRVGGDPFVAEEIAAYMQEPTAYSLTDWAGNPDGRSYGLSYMFVRYLTGRFGLNLIAELQNTPSTGIDALNEVLTSRGTSATSAYVDWLRSAAAASVVGDPGSGPVLATVTQSDSRTIRPWGALYLEAVGFPAKPREVVLHSTGLPLFFWQEPFWQGLPGGPSQTGTP